MTEPLQLEAEATPLPPAIRALCQGGPWDGSVMMAPVPRTQLFGGMALSVKIDGRSAHFRTHADAQPWIGGSYHLLAAPPEVHHAGRQVAAILGEPANPEVTWRWLPGYDADHSCQLSERMVKVHVVGPVTPEDPYEMGAALRGLADDLGVEAVYYPDGDVSFRRIYETEADHVARKILEDLEREIFHPQTNLDQIREMDARFRKAIDPNRRDRD